MNVSEVRFYEIAHTLLNNLTWPDPQSVMSSLSRAEATVLNQQPDWYLSLTPEYRQCIDSHCVGNPYGFRYDTFKIMYLIRFVRNRIAHNNPDQEIIISKPL